MRLLVSLGLSRPSPCHKATSMPTPLRLTAQLLVKRPCAGLWTTSSTRRLSSQSSLKMCGMFNLKFPHHSRFQFHS